tara:strand:+ start:286 stop:648 length:363 start_codon:yes stop_codon:yes gene_type:complete
MLRQKYIGEVKHYEVDDWFVDKIRDLPSKLGINVATQIDRSIDQFRSKEYWTQKIAGVSTVLNQPYYFECEYVKEAGEPPILLDLAEIDVDDYLDYYNANLTIKLNDNRREDKLLETNSQ